MLTQSALASEKTALYRHFGADGGLLYVGVSLAPMHRSGVHTRDAAWAEDIATIRIEWLPSRQAALDAERMAIKSDGPRHNIVHTKSDNMHAMRAAMELLGEYASKHATND